MPYRVHVVTDSVSEAIRHAGGLMFDRRRAGWDVVVTTQDHSYSRPLAILGVRVLVPGRLDDHDARSPGDPCTVIASFGTQLDDGGALTGLPDQDLLWWPQGDAGRPLPLRAVRHDLSAAARAFKDQALRCVGCLSDTQPFEVFWSRGATGADGIREWGDARSLTLVGR